MPLHLLLTQHKAHGLKTGELAVFIAGPRHGHEPKTMLAADQMAEVIAQGQKVGLIANEVSARQVERRLNTMVALDGAAKQKF